jgi:predicted metal-dependent phosphoesterase TrpH
MENVEAVASLAHPHAISLIPGLELDLAFQGKYWHLLLYGKEPENEPLLSLLERIHRSNEVSAHLVHEEILSRGYDLPPFEVIKAMRPTTHVADVAQALADKGYARDALAGFAIIDGMRLTYELDLPSNMVSMAEAIEVAHKDGLLAILAHPGRAIEGAMEIASEEELKRMIEMGLDGLEAYYPSHTQKQIAFFLEVVEEHNLFVTCGSDSHGPIHRLPYPWPCGLCRRFLEHWDLTLT